MTNPGLIELHQRGEHEEVLRVARTIDQQPAADPQTSLVVAASLYQLGRFRDSLQLLAVLEPLIRTDHAYLNLLGLCLKRLGEYERAEQVFTFALTHHPAHPVISSNFINFLTERQRINDARLVLEQALLKNPDADELLAHRDRLNSLVPDQGPAAASHIQAPATAPKPAPTFTGSEAAGHDNSEPPRSDQQPSSPLVQLPDSAGSGEADANGDPILSVPVIRPTALDPLLLAFSKEEVALDQDNRRRLRDARNKSESDAPASLEISPIVSPPLPTLPEPPLLEVSEELFRVIGDALVDKHYECALAVADYLRRLDPSRQGQLYRVCSEAYVGLGNHACAELCLQSLAALGQIEDIDRLNLAGFALRRHELTLAEEYLSGLVNPDRHKDSLQPLMKKLHQRRTEVEPSLVFSPRGLKAIRLKQSGSGSSDKLKLVQEGTVTDQGKSPPGDVPAAAAELTELRAAGSGPVDGQPRRSTRKPATSGKKPPARRKPKGKPVQAEIVEAAEAGKQSELEPLKGIRQPNASQ